MEAFRVQQVLDQDGEVFIRDLPYKKGQIVEIIILSQPEAVSSLPFLTVGDLKKSGLIGAWKDRDDIEDSVVYARQLRGRKNNLKIGKECNITRQYNQYLL